MEIQDVLDILNKKKKVPEYLSEKIEKWKGVYYGISLHTLGAAPCFNDLRTGRKVKPVNYINEEYQRIFDTALFSRHPREDEQTRQWRYSQYRPLTKAPFGQILEMLSGAIFQDSNYQIDIPDKKDSEYIWGNNFYGFDIAGYFANIGVKNEAEDPNGLFIRIPSKPFYEQIDTKVDVEIWFVNTPDIVYLTEDDLIFTRGDRAFYVDKQTIWRFTKTNKKQYELLPEDAEGYYSHMFGRLPITVAGGEWNTQGYYDSFLDKAKGIADEFIATFSAAQMVDKEASHPFIEAIPEDCPSCHGNRQIPTACDCNSNPDCTLCNGSNRVLIDCSTCHGDGTISVFPGRWRDVPKDQFKDGSIRIVNPDMSINTHHRETVKELTTQLKEALHLYNTDKSESGEAKAIDQERMYRFISSVSNQLFDKVIYDTVLEIIAYRNVKSTGSGLQPYAYDFRIVKPTQFKIKTSEDLLLELEQATKSNIPVLVRKKISYDYVQKAYNGDAVMAKKMELTNLIDTIGAYPTSEWLGMRAAGACSDRDMIISRMLPTWLDDYYQENGEGILKATKDDILTYIEPKIAEATPPVIRLDNEQEPE